MFCRIGGAHHGISTNFGRPTQPIKPRGRPFQPGQSGNPSGRPKGARNKATLAVEALLENEAEALTRKVIDLALGETWPRFVFVSKGCCRRDAIVE
jgi:Family of unknown function (DUF5681)